ncbi:MAG: hypothetical protein ABEI52_01695, partial [Halobacteriaceae archaeon]
MPSVRAAIERGFVHLLQLCLLLIVLVGAIEGSISVTVNAVLALLVTLLPGMLRQNVRIYLDPGLTLFVTVVVFLHALGMLGLYSNVWWWDHLTHTLSAMVVAGIIYVVIRAFDEHSSRIAISDRMLPVYVLALTLVAGVSWELLELLARIITDALGIEVIWIHYG